MTLLERILCGLEAALCGIVGHDPIKECADAEVYLRCQKCGKRSPGWQVERRSDPDPPVVKIYRGELVDWHERPVALPVFLTPLNPLEIRLGWKRHGSRAH